MFTNLMLIIGTLIRQILIKTCQLFMSISGVNMVHYKIFQLIKKVFFLGLTIFSSSTNINSLSCISMINQKCKTRPQIVNVNSNNPIFYPFSIKISKCSGNCNNINDPYSKSCVRDVVKNFSIKVFNLMSRINETRFIEWHEPCNCECRLDSVICNKKQR